MSGSTERARFPAPLLSHRIASGRGAMEQPNNANEQARLNARFWLALLATGLAAGGFGALMTFLLRQTQHLAFDYHDGTFAEAVVKASSERRLVALLIGGAVTGLGLWVVRRRTKGSADVDDSVWSGTGELGFRRSFATGTLSELAVGAGASIGREAAPKLLGAASGSVVSAWLKLRPEQRRLLVACGGGAGMAAVYNVPLGGALITAEVLLGELTLPVVLPALLCCALASIVAWVYLPTGPNYVDVPVYASGGSQIAFACFIGPIIGLVAVALIRAVGWMSHHRLQGRKVIIGPLVAFGALGLISWDLPELLGNGKALSYNAFLGVATPTLLTLLALAILKPFVTILCLSSGASGGLFTPMLSTGAVIGLLFGKIWVEAWPGAALGSFAIIAATAMIGASMQAPLAGIVLVLELTQVSEDLAIPMVIATTVATLVARRLDGYSIYSARLQARDATEDPVDGLHV